ncbi:MAG TPA: hypothetical protein VGD91_05430, partial [Trebonia sp.]
RTRRVLSQEEQLVQRTGRELFAALLGSGEVGHRYRASAAMAAGREQHFRPSAKSGAWRSSIRSDATAKALGTRESRDDAVPDQL